jgi:putative addiction module component (TIGR02574 family)
MSDEAKKVLELALRLKPAERQWLADELLDRLEEEPPTQEELDELTASPEFMAMLEQRLAEHDANPEAAIPGEQAMAEIRAEMERRRAWRSR